MQECCLVTDWHSLHASVSFLYMQGAQLKEPVNEPVLSYAPGTQERAALRAELARQSQEPLEIPLHIGARRHFSRELREFSAPHRHSLKLGKHAIASTVEIAEAIEAALAARPHWSGLRLEERAAIFLRAADLLSGPWRQRLNAATLLNQSKTAHQAEIDAACELIDFLRFNAYFAARIEQEGLVSPEGVNNSWESRPLDGFVFAVTPFNFTAIAGNLPTAPALLGNTVVWKPSPLAALSGEHVMALLREAGLPDGVINVVQGDAASICNQVLEHPEFAGLHFTGSTSVLRGLWSKIGDNIQRYHAYPRIVGESGGKDFIFAHPSADSAALAVAIVRGGYEFQGQKCSAASRVYVPRSLWKAVREQVVAMISDIKVGDPADFTNFMAAVIGRSAFDRIRHYQELAKRDPDCTVHAGGRGDDREGFFIEPTFVQTTNPLSTLMTDEIFGPFVTAWVYEDGAVEDALALCDRTSPYGLTGAIFAEDQQAIAQASRVLSRAAGNFYINDKPTGAVVGQQPFGGSRLSGTNDKAGSAWNLMRWISPRVIKRNFAPPQDYRYPFLEPGD